MALVNYIYNYNKRKGIANAFENCPCMCIVNPINQCLWMIIITHHNFAPIHPQIKCSNSCRQGIKMRSHIQVQIKINHGWKDFTKIILWKGKINLGSSLNVNLCIHMFSWQLMFKWKNSLVMNKTKSSKNKILSLILFLVRNATPKNCIICI